MDRIFWLHIKKSAGTTIRGLLAPHYTQVDRAKRPPCFVQGTEAEWNDILNNFRVPLGDYQFRRALFAKRFLYGEGFETYFRFAFARQPVDRCVSQFFYTVRNEGDDLGANFDRFLEMIRECRDSDSNYQPYGLHFQTHTAAMWDDVVDDAGRCLLDRIWRLEDLPAAVRFIHESMGTPELAAAAEIDARALRLNANHKPEFTPSPDQVRKIEQLFPNDFDLYETSWSSAA